MDLTIDGNAVAFKTAQGMSIDGKAGGQSRSVHSYSEYFRASVCSQAAFVVEWTTVGRLVFDEPRGAFGLQVECVYS